MIAAKTTASRATVSPTVFARIGGLPADAVPAASPEVVDYLDRLYNIDERLRSLTQPLIDQIFELVPDIADNKVRRLVLQAKREVFAGQAVSIRAERALRAVAPSGLLSAFDEWSEQLDRRETLECGLREALAADDAKMLRVLVHTVTDPDYLASLALATPELVSRILARRPSKAPSRRLVRSLYNYATRTALKTSPFSGLTTVNVAGTVGQGRSVQAVAVHLASGLLRRAAHDGARHLGLVLEPSPMGSVPAEEHEELIMLAKHVHQDGIIFREELVTGAEWAPADYSISFAPGTPTERMRRHIETGLLREQVPWSRGEDPLGILSSTFPEGIDGVSADDMLEDGSARPLTLSVASALCGGLRSSPRGSSIATSWAISLEACSMRTGRLRTRFRTCWRCRASAKISRISRSSCLRGYSGPTPTTSWLSALSPATA